jgi:hypothetical protein
VNCADVKDLYDSRDVDGLYGAAADCRNPDEVRHAAYWFLFLLDDEKARRAIEWLRADEARRAAQYATRHGGSAPPLTWFSFDSVRDKRRWWRRSA